MRRLDRWLGVPACFGLSLLRRCREGLREERPPNGKIGRVLIVKLAEQGATVLAFPAIERAVQLVGRENVYFLLFEENRFILDVMEVVPKENVLTIPTDSLPRLLRGTIAALRRLRRLDVDAALDFEFFARSSAALAYLSGARWRIGLHRFTEDAPYRGDLMTHRHHYDPQLHTCRAYSAMIESLNGGETAAAGTDPLSSATEATACGGPPRFRPAADEVAAVRALIQREAGHRDFSPLVLLNANASDLLPARRWPADRYVELAQRLLRRSAHVRIAFTGATNEVQATRRLTAAVDSPRCFCLAGQTTLRQLLVLYGLAEVLVTNDSGPAHFAALTPIRVVTLFGPETPQRFGSPSERTEILWKQLACSPCVSAANNRFSDCRENECMKQITVDEVLDAVDRAIEPS